MKADTGKVWKWIGIIGGVIAVLAVIILLILYLVIKPSVADNIGHTIKVNFGKEYVFNYDDYDFSPFSQSITFHQVSIHPDTSNGGAAENYQRRSRFFINMDRLHLDGPDIISAIFNNKAILDELAISNPQIVHYKGQNMPDKKEEGLKPKFEESIIHHVDISDGSYKEITVTDEGNEDAVDVEYFQVTVDSFNSTEGESFGAINFAYKDVSANARDIKLYFPKKYHILTIAQFSVSTKDQVMDLRNISADPKMERGELAEQVGHEMTWLKFSADHIGAQGINVMKFLQGNEIVASSIDVNGFHIDAYHNSHHPENDKQKPMPQEYLRLISYNIDIDSVGFNGGRIDYAEVPKISNATGEIYFAGINGYIKNIANNGNRDAPAVIYANGSIMGEASLDVHFTFNFDEASSFSSEGTIGTLYLPQLNPMVRAAALVQIEEGTLSKGFFNMHGNKNSASGDMRLHYNDLKFDMLSEANKEAGFKNEFLSFLASKFVIQNENPDDGELKVAGMQYSRKPTKFFFHLWWKTLVTGIRETLGIGSRNTADTKSSQEEVVEEKKVEGENKETKGAKKDSEEDDDDGVWQKIKDVF